MGSYWRLILPVAVLAACSSPGPSSNQLPGQLPAAHAVRTAQSSGPILYISDLEANSVTLYPANVASPAPLSTITSGVFEPEGIFVDRNGTLYVANSAYSHASLASVTVYPPGATQPSLTIQASTYEPMSVAADSKGNVYVGGNENGTVVINEYAAGGTTAINTVFPTGNHGDPFMGGLAVDRRDNLYASFFVYDHPPAHVVKFAPGLANERDLKLGGLDSIDLNPGLGRDAKGNLYVGGALYGINVYRHGSRKPSRTISGGFSQFFTVAPNGALYDPETYYVDEFSPGSAYPDIQFKGAQYPVGAAVH